MARKKSMKAPRAPTTRSRKPTGIATGVPLPQSTPPYSRLPRALRDKIYRLAGVPRKTFFNLKESEVVNKPVTVPLKDSQPPDQGYWSLKETHSLMLTCLQVYEEVSHLVYSSNFFFIRYKAEYGLDALNRISPTLISKLSHLTIHLSVTSCGQGWPCKVSIAPWELAHESACSPDQPARLGDPADSDMLKDWHRTWREFIRPNLTKPVSLHLDLLCDVVDLETGLFAVRPLVDELPPMLAGCRIRLSSKPDPPLRSLAQKAVMMSTTGPIKPTPSFPFTKLPYELRQRVLFFTDLVMPFGEVEWNPTHGFYHRYFSKFENQYKYDPGNLHGLRLPRLDLEKHHYARCGQYLTPFGCFCASSHAACAVGSRPRCVCWAPPTAIFLVNRAMRQDALRIFYGSNKFVVAPTGGDTGVVLDRSPRQLPISRFLSTAVPKKALRFIRSLEIVFPTFGEMHACDYCPRDSREWRDWKKTLKMAKRELVLPKLTISVHFAPWVPQCDCWDDGDLCHRHHLHAADFFAIEESYWDVLDPLKQLGGLSRLFVHLPYISVVCQCFDYVESSAQRLEAPLEKGVMGQQYDAQAKGKSGYQEGRWFYEHEEMVVEDEFNDTDSESESDVPACEITPKSRSNELCVDFEQDDPRMDAFMVIKRGKSFLQGQWED